jgi:acyl carrier protein
MDTQLAALRKCLLDVVSDLPDNNDENLFASGIFDSLTLVEVIEAIESNFNVVFDPENLSNENFSTLNRIAKTVKSLQAK